MSLREMNINEAGYETRAQVLWVEDEKRAMTDDGCPEQGSTDGFPRGQP